MGPDIPFPLQHENSRGLPVLDRSDLHGVVSAVVPQRALPEGVPLRQEPGSTILPGLIDTRNPMLALPARRRTFAEKKDD